MDAPPSCETNSYTLVCVAIGNFFGFDPNRINNCTCLVRYFEFIPLFGADISKPASHMRDTVFVSSTTIVMELISKRPVDTAVMRLDCPLRTSAAPNSMAAVHPAG